MNPRATPYTDTLKRCLKEMISEGGRSIQLHIVNRGRCGDLTQDMFSRFRRDVLSVNPHFTIILGGSNDIGWGIPPEEIFSNLKKIYEKSLDYGIIVILCTVPSILGYDILIPPRIKLNKMIKKYAIKKGLACADLFSATANPRTERLLEEYSSDGLHLNTHGYERMGEEICTSAGPVILRSIER